MKTFVKFCGLKTVEAVEAVPEGGAGGFVIDVPASPRNLSIEQAASLLEHLPRDSEAWAVVVQPSAETIHRLFDEGGVDRIQVYGTIPRDLEFLEVHHLVPSIPIPPAGTSGEKPKVPPAEDYPRIHLDAAGQPLPGGSGARPDWEMCTQIVDEGPGRKFVLAGGLTAENVGQALESVHPWGVDVSTGIESSPGVKDLEKMRSFLRAVQAFEETHV